MHLPDGKRDRITDWWSERNMSAVTKYHGHGVSPRLQSLESDDRVRRMEDPRLLRNRGWAAYKRLGSKRPIDIVVQMSFARGCAGIGRRYPDAFDFHLDSDLRASKRLPRRGLLNPHPGIRRSWLG